MSVHGIAQSPVRPAQAGPAGGVSVAAQGEAFARILQRVQQGLRISSHAKERMDSRGIALDESLQRRITSGLESLAGKGSRDGLVVVDDNRFVVSVSNRTVITALTAKDRDVYTNIDGVAFA